MANKKKAHKSTVHNKLSVAKVKVLVPDSLGSINWLANTCDVSWATMKKFIDNSVILTELMKVTNDKCISKARDNVYNAILEGDMKTTTWYLSKLAPEYKDTLEIMGDLDIKITIKGIEDDDDLINL